MADNATVHAGTAGDTVVVATHELGDGSEAQLVEIIDGATRTPYGTSTKPFRTDPTGATTQPVADQTAAYTTALLANGGVDVATTSTLVLAADSLRHMVTVVNASDTAIYLCLAATGAGVGAGVFLAPNGGSWSEFWAGPLCAVHGSVGTKRLTVVAY